MYWFIAALALPLAAADDYEFFEKRVRPVLSSNCYACHSVAIKNPLAGLLLDSREAVARSGVVVPGKPEDSKLFTALTYRHALKMPPSGKLADDAIADIGQWIKDGAAYPDTAASKKDEKFWAFQPVRREFAGKKSIDDFLDTRAPAAAKRVLIRRVTFDLTGLPPTPEEVAAFLADPSPGAFQKIVERLLASPHYGERWARHWLDLVRYAETNGHEYDNDKMNPWLYRDYVIRAFNEDVPYNQFVREHIAGDLLPEKRISKDGKFLESPLATGFLWFGEVLNSATDSAKSRADEVDNQIDVIGKAFQGLTVACARCHDHKFDPIPTSDYYALAGVLHSTTLREDVVDSPEVSARIATAKPVTALRPEDLRAIPFDQWRRAGAAFGGSGAAATSLAAGSPQYVGSLTSPKFRTTSKRFLHVLVDGSKGDKALKELGPLRFTSVCDAYKGQHVVADGGGPAWKTLTLTFERNRDCYFEIVDHSREGWIAIEEIVFSDLKEPPATTTDIPPSIFAMLAADENPRDVKIHVRGNHQTLGEIAPRRFLQCVADDKQPPIAAGSGRLEIAERMASPRNPLTARVMVNRVWKHHFGTGLVKSPDNFGIMGERPSNPELLDFLAARFVESDWSVKSMHREMVMSKYYQSTALPVRRLEAEAIRDGILSVSGSLDPALYGPSVRPHISKYQDGRGRPVSGALDGEGRRSIYIQVRRNFLSPFFLAFDYPLPISSIGARGASTVPSQALLMMNNEFVVQQARKFALRAKAAAPEDVARIRFLYERAFCRPPLETETAEIVSFVNAQSGRAEDDVWADVAHVLFNSPEFIYVQ